MNAGAFLRRHPRMIRAITGALVILAAVDLVAAIEVDIRGRELIARMQREASEALGG